MKNVVLIFIVLFSIISCSNDDDDTIIDEPDPTMDGFVKLDLNPAFLLDEKWFLDDIIADKPFDLNDDGSLSENLFNQVPSCDFDSYYLFMANDDLTFVELRLMDGEFICDNFDGRFGSNVKLVNFDDAESLGNIELISDDTQLLGGIPRAEFRFLNNSQFLISTDSKTKLFVSTIEIVEATGITELTYTLRADSNNRPE